MNAYQTNPYMNVYQTNPYNNNVAAYPSYSYQQPVIPQAQQTVSGNQVSANNFIWVQGEAGANAYPVAPNGVVWLMDSTTPRLYVKRADNTGRPFPLEKYRLIAEESLDQQASAPVGDFVSRDELERRLEEMSNKFVIRKERPTNGKQSV